MTDSASGNTRFERDLRAVLIERASPPIPWSLHQAAVTPPATRTTRRLSLSSFAVGIAGVGMVLVITAALVVSYVGRPVGAGGARALQWQTEVASLEADSLSIHAGDKVFSAPADALVHSDPGTPTYRTLEMTWDEQGVEMRLNIYFAADDAKWWVTGIRTYDGRSPGDWIEYQAPSIQAARGESYAADVDLAGSGGSVPGRLTIDSLRLTAFAPGTGVSWQQGCHFAEPGASPAGEQVARSDSEPDLSRYGISVGMSGRAADEALTAAGICHDFRLEYVASGYSQVWCAPPDGNVVSWARGSEGQLILFVNAPAQKTLPPDFTETVGCS